MSQKFQFVVDDETAEILAEIKGWIREENKTRILKEGLKQLHWRLSEQRNGNQVISTPVAEGVIVYDRFLPIIGRKKADT